MKFKYILLPAILYVFCVSQPGVSVADDTRGVLLNSQNCLFHIKAPQGWVLDTSNGAADGFEVILYPEESTYEDAREIMYVSVFPKSEFKTGTIEEIIKYYKEDTKYRIPYAEFAALKPVNTKKNKRTARVFKVNHRRTDAAGFIDESEIVVLLVLSCENKSKFESAFPAFKKLIHSYNFLGRARNVYN